MSANAQSAMKPHAAAPNARDAMALALDLPSPTQALALANELAQWFGVAKVGLELFSAAGPQIIIDLQAAGFKVFADLKLHDIPTTVRRSAQQLGRLGVSYTTLHTAGGAEMLAAGAEGLLSGAAEIKSGKTSTSQSAPVALAVTVLTSTALPEQELHRQLTERAQAASQAGCAGVICAAADIAVINAASEPKHLLKVVPGVRPAGTSADDQARVATPAEAITAGADLLVIGRAVTAAPNPAAAAAAIATEIQTALASRH